jgi:hypothetical protein
MYGCGHQKINPAPIPDGTYSGEFRRLHIHPDNRTIVDTEKTNLVVHFDPVSVGTYTVTGDTSTIHAGSKGNFQVDANNSALFFIDKTYPATGTPSKTHLNGGYLYNYDGTSLKMAAPFTAADTIALQYDLKRTGN